MGNPPFKFGHAWPLGSQIIRYVRDGQTDGRTKAMLIAPSFWRGHKNSFDVATSYPFLPRDAMHKLVLCRHAVYVCLSRSWIVSKRIKI